MKVVGVHTPILRAAGASAGRRRGIHAAARALEPIARGNEATHLPEAMGRHPAVDRLVVAGADAIRLVPDADVAAAPSHALVEGDPRRPVLAIGAPRVLLERVERTPVLDQREARRLHAEQAR